MPAWNAIPIRRIPDPPPNLEFTASATEIRCFSDNEGEDWWFIATLPITGEQVALPMPDAYVYDIVGYTPEEEWAPEWRFGTWVPPKGNPILN